MLTQVFLVKPRAGDHVQVSSLMKMGRRHSFKDLRLVLVIRHGRAQNFPLTASSHSSMSFADTESRHAAHLDALHFLPLNACRHSPAHAAALLAWSILPRARLICGAINSPSLRNLLTDFPHACLRSTPLMQIRAMIVAAIVFGNCRVKRTGKKQHCVQKSGLLEVSYQLADGVREMGVGR